MRYIMMHIHMFMRWVANFVFSIFPTQCVTVNGMETFIICICVADALRRCYWWNRYNRWRRHPSAWLNNLWVFLATFRINNLRYKQQANNKQHIFLNQRSLIFAMWKSPSPSIFCFVFVRKYQYDFNLKCCSFVDGWLIVVIWLLDLSECKTKNHIVRVSAYGGNYENFNDTNTIQNYRMADKIPKDNRDYELTKQRISSFMLYQNYYNYFLSIFLDK